MQAAELATTVFQVRFHGRGGQGVLTAAELLSTAAHADGHEAQAFLGFGSERAGAVVTSFCRIDDAPIRALGPVTEPDAIVVLDPALIDRVDLFSGLQPDGYVLINTFMERSELAIDELDERIPPGHLLLCPASEIAREHLGQASPNAALLGALVALTHVVSLEALVATLRERFSGTIGDGNIASAKALVALVVAAEEEDVGAPSD